MVMIRKYRSSISRRHGLIAATDQGNTTQGESPTNKRGWIATPIDLGEVTDGLDVLSQVRR